MEKLLAEYVAKMKTIHDQQNEIVREASLNNEGEFTDEQRSQYESLDVMYEQFKAKKVAIEKDLERTAKLASRDEDFAFTLPTRKTPANSGSPANVRSRKGMPVEREDSETGETRITFKIPKNIIRIGSPQNFHGKVDDYSAEERAYRFGMWALAKVSDDMPGRFNFEQAKQFVSDYMRPSNTAHGETNTTNGQVLVPDEFSRDLIVLREQYGVVRRLFGRAVMSGDTLHTPKRTTGLTAYFVNENAAGTESNMTWGDIQLVAKDLMILSRMSNQLSMDAVISVGDTLAGEISYAFANKEDDCGINGDGTSTYGGIRGVRTLLTSIDDGGTDSAGLSVCASASTWATIALSDFNACVGLLPQYADTPNACWVAHRAFYYGVMQRLELAAGGVAAMEIASGDRRPRPLFCGYPVEFSQIMPSSTATDTVCALLGDFSQGALFGDRQQTSVAFSEHGSVGGQSVWERNQIAIRGTERFDINVHGCGSSSAVGPIVGLATHS